MSDDDKAVERGEYKTWKTPESGSFNQWLGLILDSERMLSQLSKDDLARQSGIPKRALYRILSGEKEISIKELFMIAPALGKHPTDLWQDAEKRMGGDSRPRP